MVNVRQLSLPLGLEEEIQSQMPHRKAMSSAGKAE
jgi:hypothetical protein